MVGFSVILPVCRQSLPILRRSPVAASVLEAYLSRVGVAALPATPEATRTFYLLHLAHLDAQLEAVRAALLRDYLAIFALGGVYLATTPIEIYQRTLEACGFERVPGTTSLHWGSQHPAVGFLLDLTGVGVEAWIEAIMAGRPPPRRLKPDELQQALQSALLHWHDDARLGSSPLADSIAPDALAASGPEALRAAIRAALERARAGATPQQALAYRALERAYLERDVSHERVADQMAVSRTTFYRLLKRGLQGLSAAFVQA